VRVAGAGGWKESGVEGRVERGRRGHVYRGNMERLHQPTPSPNHLQDGDTCEENTQADDNGSCERTVVTKGTGRQEGLQ
jgi:hypothetical protein